MLWGAAQTTRVTARIVLTSAAVVGSLYLIYLTRQVWILLVIAVIFALAVAPAVDYLDRKGMPRQGAIMAVYAAIVAAIVGIGLLLVPPLVKGVDNLSQDLPGYVRDLRHNKTFREYDNRYDITSKLEDQAKQLPSKLGDAAGALSNVTVGVFSSFLQLFLILVVTYFLLMDGSAMLAWLYRQLPEERERRARAVAEDISRAVGGYVAGNLAISLIAGTVTFVTLTILDIPFAVPLAILVAFFDLIPLVGATIGGLLVAIVVSFVDFPTGLIVWAIVFFVYQQVENNLLQPYIYGRTVQLHPLAVILAILIGAGLLGILGALLAIPAAAAVQSAARDFWRAREDIPDPPPPDELVSSTA